MNSKKTVKKQDEELEILEEEIVIQKPKRSVKKPVQVKVEPEPEPEDEPEPETPKPEPKFKLKNKNKPDSKNTGANWVMTPARAEALKKAQARLKERNEYLAEQKALQKEEERKIIEEKVIKKAIALKKRQLKKEALIDEIPVDVPLRPKPRPLEPFVPKYKYY
jgi:colicin import membrane protein